MRKLTVLTAAALSAALAAPAFATPAETSAPKMSKDHHASQPSIVSIATGDENFSTLVTALQTAGLVDALSGDGPFTVFAPTDEAFAALPEGVVADLLKPENKDKLTAVLTYHVVPGRVYAVDAIAAEEAETLQGSSVTIEQRDGGVFIDGACVVSADLDTTNGVIHVIDKVILPQD